MCYNSAWGEQTCHDYKINPQIRNLGVLNLRYCRAVSALHSPALSYPVHSMRRRVMRWSRLCIYVYLCIYMLQKSLILLLLNQKIPGKCSWCFPFALRCHECDGWLPVHSRSSASLFLCSRLCASSGSQEARGAHVLTDWQVCWYVYHNADLIEWGEMPATTCSY